MSRRPRSRPDVLADATPHPTPLAIPSRRTALTALALLAAAFALAGCNRGEPDDDVALAPDDATAAALQAEAVGTNEALANEDGAPAPTNALGGAAVMPTVEPYTISGAPSEPEAIRAAEHGGLDRPLLVVFVAEGCEVCAAIEGEVVELSEGWSDRVAFATVDVDDPAAADVVRRLAVEGAPTFVLLNSAGSPAGKFTEWPGVEAMGSYLEAVLLQDPGAVAPADDEG